MQEQVFDLLLNQEDVSWKSILYELVKTEQMDPWDIDITLLTQRYIEIIREMQEHDFRISGKILLAAAFLLKIKSAHLLEHDISNLDRLLNRTEETGDEDDLLDQLHQQVHYREKQPFTLIPRNPQPRDRKVSIHDLIDALQRTMATKKRMLAQQRPTPYVVPPRKIDIIEAIRDLYHKINYYTQKEEQTVLPFTHLLPPRAGKQDKVYTFIPLLHLEQQRKVETEQKQPFDPIYIRLLKRSKQPSE